MLNDSSTVGTIMTSKNLMEIFSTITVRHVPADVDAALTAQAKAAGRSKSDFVQELLCATFGDLIGNYIRTSPLVDLMDRELAKLTGAELEAGVFEAGMTLRDHREFCDALGILDADEVHGIMMNGIPYLDVRAGQLKGVMQLPPGASLYAALMAEAARQGVKALKRIHKVPFHTMPLDDFMDAADEFRRAMRLPLIEWNEI